MNDTRVLPCTNGVCCALLQEMHVVEQKCDSIYVKLSELENHDSTNTTLNALESAARDMLEQSIRLREYVEQQAARGGLRISWEGEL